MGFDMDPCTYQDLGRTWKNWNLIASWRIGLCSHRAPDLNDRQSGTGFCRLELPAQRTGARGARRTKWMVNASLEDMVNLTNLKIPGRGRSAPAQQEGDAEVGIVSNAHEYLNVIEYVV